MTKTISLLKDAQQEIIRLRRENELLAAQVRIMDLFARTLHAVPYHPSPILGVDLAWQLNQEAERLQTERNITE